MTAACSTNRPREDRSVSESGVGALSPPANVIGKNNHVVAETTVGGRSVRLKGRFLQRRVKGGGGSTRGPPGMPIDQNQTSKFWLPAAEILLGGAALALLTLVGLWLDLNLGTASLIYVIVIVLVSLRGNLIPAVVLSIIAAGCLDYFFTVPRFSLDIDTPQDTVAVAAFATTALVVTGLVRRARRLGEAAALKDRLQIIIDTIPAVVWSNSPDGSADFLNKRFRDYTGLSLEEGRGWAWMDALHPDDCAMDDWRAALAAGEPFEKEARLRRADGEYRRFLLRFVPLRDAPGS